MNDDGKDKKSDKDNEEVEMVSFLDIHYSRLNEVDVHTDVESLVNEFNEANEKGKMFWKPLGENTALIRIRDGQKLLESFGIQADDVSEVSGDYQIADCVVSIEEVDFKDSKVFEAFVFVGDLEKLNEDKYDNMTPAQLKKLSMAKGTHTKSPYKPNLGVDKTPSMKDKNDPTQSLVGKNKIYTGATPGASANRFAKKQSMKKPMRQGA